MVQTKSANNKKRSANSKLQNKPAKALKTQPVEDHVEEKQEEGLFDNLDEEMDPNELEDIVNNLNEDSESEGDVDEEEETEDEEDAEQVFDEEDEASEQQDEDEMMEEDKEEVAPVSNEQQSTSKKFRDLYMTKVTQAFGSDLDQIRQVRLIDLEALRH
ncbi:unnamed protein product [Mucor circinelloides]